MNNVTSDKEKEREGREEDNRLEIQACSTRLQQDGNVSDLLLRTCLR